MTSFKVEDYIERAKEQAPGVTNQKWASLAFTGSMAGVSLTYLLLAATFLNREWAPQLRTTILWIYGGTLALFGVAVLMFAFGFLRDLGQFFRLMARQIDQRSQRLRELAAELAASMSQQELELALRDVRFDVQLRERTKAKAALLGAIGSGLIAVVGGLPGSPVTLSLGETLAYSVPAWVLGASIALGCVHSFIDRLTCLAYAIEEAIRLRGADARKPPAAPTVSADHAA